MAETSGASSLQPNEQLLIAALHDNELLSRADIARLTGLPKTTVTGLVRRLLRNGVLAETAAPARSSAPTGRPATMLTLASPHGLVAALVLTHGRLRAAALGFDGTIRARAMINANFLRLPDGVVGPGVRLLDTALAAAGLDRGLIRMAVLGIPLPFQRGKGVAVLKELSPGLRKAFPGLPEVPRWLRADPSGDLGASLGVPAVAENDANLGALGEATFGSGKGASSMLYIKFAEGIGAGLVIDGRLHRGASEVAGEIAHLRVRDDGPLCACGGRGCLATMFGRPSLIGLIQPAYDRELSFADVITLAAHGDQGVLRILRDLGQTVGRAVADFCLFINPEAIILDGLLGAASEPIAEGIREAIRARTPPPVADAVRVSPGGLGDQAELLGALVVARTGLLSGE